MLVRVGYGGWEHECCGDAVGPTGAPDAVARIPSGRAVRGFDPDDDGSLELLEGGSRRRSRSSEFVVTLDVPDGAVLPTRRAVSTPV